MVARDDENAIQEFIRYELDGCGSLQGYRTMYKRLYSKHGTQVPRFNRCKEAFERVIILTKIWARI